MTRPWRLARNAAIGLAGLAVLLGIAAFFIVQTGWFRDYVRAKIISATEDGTGGRVEIGSFQFDVTHLRAVVTDFVIHGKEPAGADPLVRAARVQLDIRLLTSIQHLLDIHYLGIDRVKANVMVFPNGTTNIPEPKVKSTSDTTALESIVDLAVDHFEITNGVAVYDSRPQTLNINANNVRAELFYNILQKGYQGRLQLEPLYIVSGRNTPVRFKISLPVGLTKDRIDFHDGLVSTSVSSIAVNGSLENIRNPKVTAHLNGHVAMIDLATLGNLPLAINARGVPGQLELDANAVASDQMISVTGLRATVGRSNIEASGKLKDPQGNAALSFKTQLAVDELGKLAKLPANASGTILLNGIARLDAANNYNVSGNVEARNVSFQQGRQQLSNVNLSSALEVDPHNVNLRELHLSALGGEFNGNVLLADFQRYAVQGNLRNFDLQAAASAFGQKIPYDGIASGAIEANGDTRAEGTKGLAANARLSIAPGRRGIPLSGKINAKYDGSTDNVIVENSYLALPHSRLTLSGSANRALQVNLTSKDLNDLLAAANLNGPAPIALNGGQADFNGTLTGALTSPRIAGHLAVTRFSVEGRQFNELGADIAASPAAAAVQNGSLTRGPMEARFAASVGLRNWSAPPTAPLSATVSLVNGDVADAMALSGQPSAGYSGAFTASARVGGTVGNPTGSASLQAVNGTLYNERFDRLEAQVNLADQLVTVPTAFIEAPAGRIHMTAEFRHPRESFSTGTVHAHVQSPGLDIGKIRQNSGGSAQLNADVNGSLTSTGFQLANVNGDVSARGVRYEGQQYGDLNATARTNGQTVNYNLTSDFAGSNVRVNGATQLVRDYPTTADATIANLPVERVLAIANRSDIPARGVFSGTAHVSGTMQNPQGTLDAELIRAVLYDEPIDRIQTKVTYAQNAIDLSQLRVTAGPSQIDLTAHYDHPAGNLQQGTARFNLNSSHVDLARIRNVQKLRPGLGGTLDLAASGAGTVIEKNPRILFTSLDANLAATGLQAQGKNFGDLKLTANTSGSNRLNFTLASNLAGSDIQGGGTADLAGDYPVNAQVTFSNVAWTRIQSFIGTDAPPAFEAIVDGRASVSGPVLKQDQLNGALQLSRLNLTTIARTAAAKSVTISNQGPIAIALDRGTVRIQSAHLVGPNTDIQATGTAVLATQAMNFNLNANADLGALQNFDRDLYSAGKIVLATTVRGTFSQPLLNGQMTLQNASANYAGVPTGISNANGTVLFSGDSARIQTLTAEAGGGKLSLSGFAGFSNTPRFGLRASANNVRVRVEQGVSINADADVQLTGTAQNSVISGTVTVQRVSYAPQSDIGSLLSRAAPPVQSPTAPSPLLENMRLDLRVRTAPGLAVQASLAENLQASADLRVRGTAAQPGILGRVTINEGKLVFFGSEYQVDTGTISFYNPIRVEPILDISLETQAKGVNVILRVTGPVDNMKLSYTSDPPLQFQEIVSLLASGKTPTSDPTLLANQPQQPAQNFQQMGESAIVSKALADPVASRLQRVFGVSQLKIDPSFTTGSDIPTARLTLQQRISSNLTFTYTSAINDPNGTIVRIEWAFNPQFSAVATRDQNGIFSINFFYKRQFR